MALPTKDTNDIHSTHLHWRVIVATDLRWTPHICIFLGFCHFVVYKIALRRKWIELNPLIMNLTVVRQSFFYSLAFVQSEHS